MLGVAVPGARAWVSEHHGSGRKLPYSWQLAEVNGVLIPVNTSNPNRIVAEALDAKTIPELAGYKHVRPELKYGENSRVDFFLEGGRRRKPCYVEVKNVHLSRRAGLSEFPDSVTARGAKHLRELMTVRQNGARAVMLFVVQRDDCARFRPAADIDPVYAATLAEASDAGVELLCYDCEVSTAEVVLRKPLRIEPA